MKETITNLLFSTLRKLAMPHPRLYRFVQASMHEQAASEYVPRDETVVVLAPHMDDEVLGCGGTIARHVRAGGAVSVVFLTNSLYGGGHAGQSLQDQESARQKLIVTRKEEARRADEILGVKSQFFLDADATHLATDTLTPGRLRGILEQARPSIVYLPSFLDRHPDHRATSDVLIAATTGTSLSFECRGYEIWTPLFPNRLVRIDDTIELKTRALACYQSQLAHTDYLHIGLGLNAYRSSMLAGSGCRFAEAFHALPLAGYRRLYGLFRHSLSQ